ncbi:MAG TPA: ATP-binding protein [Lentimicrobium sp.]|nr:ATP-binding protein [Lentimicrobium sp.]
MKKILLPAILLICFHVLNGQDINSMKKQLNQMPDDTSKVQLLFHLFDYYRYTFPDTAITYAQQALDISQSEDFPKGVALAQLFMCETFSMLGNDPQALNYGFKALEGFEKLKDTMGICNTSTSIGNFYSGQNDFVKSLKYYHKALNTIKYYHDQSNVLYFWGGISGIYLKTNQLDSALYFAEKAYKANPDWGYGLRLMATVKAETGYPAEALNYFRQAKKAAIRDHLPADLIEVYIGIAKLHSDLGNSDSTIWYATKALSEIRERTYPSGILELSQMLSRIYEERHINDSAIKYLKLTSSIKDELYNTEKVRAFQNISFNEELKRKEVENARLESHNRLRLYLLLAGFLGLIMIVVFLYRNNLQKEKTNKQLSLQKLRVNEEKLKAEAALKELKITQSQLIQSEKMASLGELTAGIAHEIQNPLNFVTNFSQVSDELLDDMKRAINRNDLDEALNISETVKENLGRINHHGKRADAIVKGMLYHSRKSSGVKEPTDINALIDEYLRLTYHGLRAKDKSFNATMSADLDKSIKEINVMPQEIGRVILNLFANAFYAVNEKKKLTLNGYIPSISVKTKDLGKEIEIVITDNGIGIPKKVLDKIFQPFFTTKPSGEGTGLGLSLSFDIITKGHDGTMNVDTNEGEGTKFTIVLPK